MAMQSKETMPYVLGRKPNACRKLWRSHCSFYRDNDRQPKLVLAYLKRARAPLALHNYQEATGDYKRALEIDPEFVMKYFARQEGTLNKLVQESIIN